MLVPFHQVLSVRFHHCRVEICSVDGIFVVNKITYITNHCKLNIINSY